MQLLVEGSKVLLGPQGALLFQAGNFLYLLLPSCMPQEQTARLQRDKMRHPCSRQLLWQKPHLIVLSMRQASQGSQAD